MERYPSGSRGRFAKPLDRFLAGAGVRIPPSPPVNFERWCYLKHYVWRGGRVVDGTGLENRQG